MRSRGSRRQLAKVQSLLEEHCCNLMYNSDFLKDFCSDAKPIYSVAFWLDLDATLEVF